MPIGFIETPQATALAWSSDEKNLVRYLAALVRDANEEAGADFHVSLAVNLSFTRSSKAAASMVAVTNDPNAPQIQMTEEDIRSTYPWDYAELTSRLTKRYINFKINHKYHGVRKPLMEDRRFVKSRYLDPGNPKSARKNFYNPNIVREFDNYYTKKA